MAFINEKISIKFCLIFLIWIIIGLIWSGFLNLQEWNIVYEWIQLQDNTEKWMTFMSILSTLFAVFFVYSGFAINQNLEKVEEQTREFKREKQNYENSFQIEKLIMDANIKSTRNQFEDALDLLDDLLRKDFVERDKDFIYRVYKEISTLNEQYALYFTEQKTKEKIEDEVIWAIYYNAIEALNKAHSFYQTEDNKISLKRLEERYNKYSIS